MANLYLTHKCRRGCPFCFARKVLKAAHNVEEKLTLDEIERFVTHYEGQIDSLGLLGGEPFLYPDLVKAIELLKRHHIHSKIFTSATDPLPEGLAEFDITQGDINFIVNVGSRDTYTDEKFANLERFFEKFHSISALSYTIFDLDNDNPEFLFDMIDHYGLVRNIRTGIALPIYRGGNSYISLDDYKRAAEYFCACAEKAAKRRITLAMDCGFQACMFTDSQLGRLFRLGTNLGFMCGAALDIGPGLKVWNCFPLFQLGCVDALGSKTLEELKQNLQNRLEEELGSARGVRPECVACELYDRKLCEGGCKSFKSVAL